jgi:hypothetical protein
MAPSSRPVAAFFEPGAPPPPLPLLTSRTELSYNTPPPAKTVAREELLQNSGPGRTIKPPTIHARVKAPQIRIRDERSDSESSSSDSSDSDSSESDSSEPALSEVDSSDGRVQRPGGEPGRPGRGGYNLEEAVGWNGKDFKRLQVCHHPTPSYV